MSLLNVLKFITNHPVNSNQKMKALWRFVQWQISSRMAPGAIVYDWIDGARFLVRNGETGLTGNIYTGLHEFPDMAYLLHVLRGDDLFVDIGANVGSYSILACAARGAHGIAFEPIPSSFARLTENIRLNRVDERVSCRNVGLGRAKSTLFFTSDRDTVNHALAEGEHCITSIAVPVVTIDETVTITAPTLIKIDVEGYETPVLEGAQRTLDDPNVHSVIIELNGSGAHYGYDEAKIISRMLAHGFKTYAYDPFSRSLELLNSQNSNSGNTIFIRNEELVRERLRTAPVVMIFGHAL